MCPVLVLRLSYVGLRLKTALFILLMGIFTLGPTNWKLLRGLLATSGMVIATVEYNIYLFTFSNIETVFDVMSDAMTKYVHIKPKLH